MVDVFIIGAGPIGLACGIEAKKAGLTYVIVDKGCLVNSLFNYPLNMTFFSTSDRLEIGGVPFVSHLHKPNRAEALEYYRRVAEHWALDIRLYEEVLKVSKHADGHFQISTSKARYESRAVVVATGFYDIPKLMNIPGEDLPKVKHYYKEPHPYIGQKVAVIGASNSAVDVALEIYRKGGDVTMIVRDSELKSSVKYWVRPDIENRIEEGAIKAWFNTEVQEIYSDKLVLNTPNGLKELPNDFVFAMTGYQPDFSFLEKLGVQIQNDEMCHPVVNFDTMETNVPGLYLAGVVCGGLETRKWFIENSRIHAEVIAGHLSAKQKAKG